MTYDRVGYAAKEGPSQTPESVATDHDEIGRPFRSDLSDDIGGVTYTDEVTGLLRKAHVPPKFGERCPIVAIRNFKQLLGGNADLAGVGHRRLDDVDRRDLRAERLSQVPPGGRRMGGLRGEPGGQSSVSGMSAPHFGGAREAR